MNQVLFISLLFLFSYLPLSMAEKSPLPPAPQPPGSEIMLFDVSMNAAGVVSLSPGINISHSTGYDSQPRFSADGKTIYYTHFFKGQMDVYEYNIEKATSSAYLTTAESEYSPTPMPEKPGLSVVQVDAKGDQYLVFLDNQAEPEKQVTKYSDLKQVGYFNWTLGQHLWAFILSETGGDLYHADQTKQAHKVTSHIGRSFITDAEHKTLYFVDKTTVPWHIRSVNSEQTEPQDVMALPRGVEDFTLDAQGRLWAGRNNTLYVSIDHKRWYIAIEFDLPGLSQITRITTNPAANQMAIVFAETPNKE